MTHSLDQLLHDMVSRGQSLFGLPDEPQLAALFPLSIAVALCSILALALGFALIRRRKNGTAGTHSRRERLSQLAYWCVAPPLVAVLYLVDSSALLDRSVPPAAAMEIRAVATNDGWAFTYGNDKPSTKQLRVPVGRPLRIVLSSNSRPRGFQVAEFAASAVAHMGCFADLWFTPRHPGTFPVDCGTTCPPGSIAGRPGDSVRGGTTLSVTTESAFQAWFDRAADTPVSNPGAEGSLR